MVPLLFLVLMIPSLLGIPRIRRRMRETYPVGLELQGQVTDEQLRLDGRRHRLWPLDELHGPAGQ